MKVVVERPVRADAERLWGFVGRVADWADLLPTVDEVTIVDDGPTPHVGARYALRQPGLPRLVYEVTKYVPQEHFTWVASAPGVCTTGTHTITPARDGCLLTLTLGWTGTLSPLVALLFTTRTQRYVELEADTFTALAEGRRRSGDR
ncbi:MAG: SRPBCC family protein [Janthinobacterium lividum]